MFLFLYNMILITSFPMVMGLLLTTKRCQRGILARLGKVPGGLQGLSGPVVWVHAASLGEVTAVVPLIRAMKEKDPHQVFVVSTVTETGREMVLNRLQGIAIHCYAPLDFWWAVTRYVRVLNPHMFILVESEIWPNLLTRLHQQQVPICLVNGRVSSRSFSRYRLVKRFMMPIWASLDMALMQTAQDAERIKELGAKTKNVHVTGNMKFDQSFERSDHREVTKTIRHLLGIKDFELVIVAGSTHPQEEEILLRAYQDLSRTQKHVVLVMAPRHIERASGLEDIIRCHGLTCVRRSQMTDGQPGTIDDQLPRVILLDSRGELPNVYSVGVLGVVGGTFVSIGGHNLLEPAQWARPVVFGPHVDHCRDLARQLLDAGGAIQIHQPDTLLPHLLHLIEHPVEADQMGEKALSVIHRNRGVVSENLRVIRQLAIFADSTALDSPSAGVDSVLPPQRREGDRYESSSPISS